MALWTPAEITTELWLDADDSSTITLNGSNVSQWDDKSGNIKHAEQGTASLQPPYDSANGLIDFTTGDHILISPHQIDINNVAVISVAHGSFSYRRQGANGRFYYGYNRLRKGSTNISLTLSAGFSVCYAESASNSFTVIGNGGEDSATAGDTNNATLANFPIGGGNQLSTNSSVIDFYANCKVKEVIVFSSLPTTEVRQKVEGYLAHKWGLAANLPAGHPYKSAAPTSPTASGNARINETTASRLVVAYDTTLTEVGRDVPDDTTTPPGDYEIVAGGPIYLQSHAFDPAKWRGIWQADTLYDVGDVVFTEASGEGLVVECTTAGASQATAPTWNTTVGGDTDEGAA